MSVGYESQVFAICDACNASEFSSVCRLAEFKGTLRSKGWTIGKNTICPECNEKRMQKRTARKEKTHENRA